MQCKEVCLERFPGFTEGAQITRHTVHTVLLQLRKKIEVRGYIMSVFI